MKSPSQSAFERVIGTPRGDYLNNLGGVPGGVAARVPGLDLNAFRPADVGSGRDLRSQVSQGTATPAAATPGVTPPDVALGTVPSSVSDPIRQGLVSQARALGQSIGETVRPLIGDREALAPFYSTFQPQVHALRAQWQATEPVNPGGNQGQGIDPRFNALYDRYLRGGG